MRGKTRGRKGPILVIALLAGLLMLTQVRAAATPNGAEVQQALEDLKKGNYEEALAALTGAWEKGPRTPEKAFYLGQVHRAMLDYRKAVEFLEEAVKLKPQYHEARLFLADTLIALDRPDAAAPHLEILAAASYKPGEVALLQGMVAAKQGKPAQAADYFREAQKDPAVAGRAKLQLSMALAAQNKVKEAKAALKEVIELDPQGQLAGFAQRHIAELDRRGVVAGPVRFSVGVGVDFDSNVTLQPGGSTGSQQISGRSDAVFTQTGTLEYSPLRGPFEFKMLYSIYQNFHPKISSFDTLSHTFGVSPSYTFKADRLTVPLAFNYTDVESDKYYTAFYTAPTWLHLFSPKVAVEAGARFYRNYYWFPLSFPQDDRSGKTVGGSLGAYYFFKEQQGYLQIRGSYEHDFASGTNWENNAYRLFLAALYPVNRSLKFNVFVDLVAQPYNRSFFDGVNFGSKRHDEIMTLGTQAIYQIYKGFEFNVHYYFVRDKSNVNTFNYHRHIVGAQLGYRY